MSFSTLMSPGQIGGLEFRNRILMTPMGSNLAQADGHCGDRIQTYYEARARGGAGAVIVGVAAIAWPNGACNPNQVAISSDDFLPGLTGLATRVKRHGCRAVVQLQHAGKVAVCDITAGIKRAVSIPVIAVGRIEPEVAEKVLCGGLVGVELAEFLAERCRQGGIGW